MGIDISGGMLVGAHGSDLVFTVDEELHDWAERERMDRWSEYYDSEQVDSYYGYGVGDVKVSQMDEGWLKEVRRLAAKFEELTGVEASLIGTQDVS